MLSVPHNSNEHHKLEDACKRCKVWDDIIHQVKFDPNEDDVTRM